MKSNKDHGRWWQGRLQKKKEKNKRLTPRKTRGKTNNKHNNNVQMSDSIGNQTP
jgi:hypothetical protein